MRYTLRQLDVFLAIARFENITRAAQHLSMSQSAASSSLKDLEQQFDIQLFDRRGKRLQINELGRALRPQAEAVIEQAAELEREFIGQRHGGQLKIGATLTIGNYLAVELLARFMAQHHSLARLHVANTAEIAQQVADFELDVGLIEGELQHSELEVIPWRQDELVICCAPGHPLASRKRLSDRDLLAAQWILRESGSGTRQAFDRAMTGLLPEMNVLLELEHTEAIKRAVEQQLGLSCLSRIALRDAFAAGRLIPLAVERDLRRQLYIVLRRDKYRSAALKSWLALCREAAED